MTDAADDGSRGGRAARWLVATWRGRALLAVVAAAAVAAIVLLTGEARERTFPPVLAEAVAYDGRSPREPAADRQRVLLELQRPPLGRVPGVADMKPGAQRAYVASLKREARALRGALEARGVKLSDVASFERCWNGFAATVDTRDLAAISSLGVRAQPVRRFYPALGEPVAAGRAAGNPGPPKPRGEPVALLASGVARSAATVKGYDAVDRDGDASPGADPRDPRRREGAGSALAGVLAGAGARVRPIRVAALRLSAGAAQPEEMATSDGLLAGLERAVDADGDGATDDHARVALVGVSAPYAGFAESPEAEAAAGAAGLGTLVVAPAGGEGPARPPSGTVGSPGAAADVVAVAALSAAAPRAELRMGDLRIRDAAVLAGTPPWAGSLPVSRLVTAVDPKRLLAKESPRLQGTLALVHARANPGAQVAAAAGAGARAVLLVEPRDGRPLAAIPAGRVGVPVLGVTGAAARAVLADGPGSRATVGRARPGRLAAGTTRLSPFSSRGPALDGAPKPDLAAPGAAPTTGADGRPVVAGGSAVSAALVAAEAGRIARARPDADPAALRAALTGAADPGGDAGTLPANGAGAGALRRAGAPGDALQAPIDLEPVEPGKPFSREQTVELPAAAARVLAAADRGATATATLAREGTAKLTVTGEGLPAGAFATGRLTAEDDDGRPLLSLPFALAAGAPAPVPVGPVKLVRRGGEVVGVSFALGAFDRGDPLGAGTAFQPVERLDLSLVRPDGALVRRLTPPGGARELLPAEYAYTIPARTLARLGRKQLVFRVRASGPRQERPTDERSEAFQRP